MHLEHPRGAEPSSSCDLCPRLLKFRQDNAIRDPAAYNGAVASFGPYTARMLIIGLAPGLQGANKTGRPFTGDQSGALLFSTLEKFGYTNGVFENTPDDSFQLEDCMITNALGCVPPQNKPIASEIKNCRAYLSKRISGMPNLKVILTLGKVAHDATVSALELARSDFPFRHGQIHTISEKTTLISSYHCSRYNLNTKRLTEEMFNQIFVKIGNILQRSSRETLTVKQ